MPKIIDNHWLTISFGVLISILVILAPEKDKEPHSKIVNYGPANDKNAIVETLFQANWSL